MRNFSKQAKEDHSLVKDAVKTGNPRAFNELMVRHRDPIYFRILEMVNGDKELAKELTIEAFGKAFNKIHLYVPKYAFSTWLHSIARNNLIDYMRKKKLKTISIQNEYDSEESHIFQIRANILDPQAQLEKKQRIKILRKIVEQLNPNYRALGQIALF